MFLKGTMTIYRESPGNDIILRLRDSASHVDFLFTTLTPENFALALTNMAEVPCEIQFREGAPLGKVREFKTVLVPHPTATLPFLRDIQVAELIAPYEVDGWKAYMPDMFNGNKAKRTGDNGEWMQEVGFVRYVEKTSQTDPNSGE